MAFLAWNVRGLNKDARIKEVKTLLAAKRIEIFGLNETKIKKQRQDEVREKFGGNWEIHTNVDEVQDPNETETGNSIWLGWENSIWEGEIISKSKQHIHCKLRNLGGLKIYFTTIYGKNRKAVRELLWDKIREIKVNMDSLPWIISGDFNEIRYQTEREGQGDDEDDSRKFNELIDNLDLIEMGTTGGDFTWTNCSNRGNLVRSKIDRTGTFTNEEWKMKWPVTIVEFYKGGTSDHVAQLIKIGREGKQKAFQSF
ncbi:hypothetical protein ZOSMA_17G00720 [Zostera marina]|uniref:Endonuclease/exonuclease/phosphatase domain-containing protein n=1 Tax=Zostera marina TaxID=29655 RepID=A0A0K9PTE5_ZOSMR|nr:hypothetical protein ZOSMA_17G00720 [Zostera marina]